MRANVGWKKLGERREEMKLILNRRIQELEDVRLLKRVLRIEGCNGWLEECGMLTKGTNMSWWKELLGNDVGEEGVWQHCCVEKP